MRVVVRVSPRSARARVGGRHGDALVVAVHEAAVDGRATQAALDAVAAALGVRRRDVTLVTGATSRTKVFDVTAGDVDDATLGARLAALLDAGAKPS